MHSNLPGLLAVVILGVSVTTGFAQSDKETSAEKIRKVLDQPIALDISSWDFQEVAKQLKNKTGVEFVIDQTVAAQVGMALQMGRAGLIAPAAGINGPNPALEVKSDGAKLRQSLRKLLAPYDLSFVVLENSVLITSEEMVVTRQMGQRISLNVESVQATKALKDLARTYALNLIIDPRVQSNEVTLSLENTTVETAVRLLAELGGVKSVRMDNVLYVTTEAHADKLRKEHPPALPTGNPNGTYYPPAVIGGPMGGMGFGPAPAPAFAPGAIPDNPPPTPPPGLTPSVSPMATPPVPTVPGPPPGDPPPPIR